jgi:hypothetical protein
MPRETRDFFRAKWQHLVEALAVLASHQNPDGTPLHPDHGVCTSYSTIPTSAGVSLPDLPCKFIVLKNRSGVSITYKLSNGVELSLLNGQDERLPVCNASQVKLYDAGDNNLAVGWYAVV